MPKWEYRELIVWSMGSPRVNKDNRGWYQEYREYLGIVGERFALMSAGKSNPRRLPLNPGREWENVPHYEHITWVEEEGYADVSMDVMNKIGAEGWELVFIDSAHYIFKRPV